MSEDGWDRMREAARLAASHPDRLCSFLPELRTLPEHIQHYTLDVVGLTLALAAIERPTLAELRAALGCPDAAPRARHFHTAAAIPVDFDEVLLAFVVDALGCADEPVSSGPKPRHPGDSERPPTGSSAGWVSSSTWLVETTHCTIRIEWTNDYFSGDVNEPAREFDHVVLEATRRGRPASVRVSAFIGAKEMSVLVDATSEERDQILAKFWRAFAQQW
ncbi:MAG: hypothetical protein ABI867_16235 [Kofleriaceae bacterium]